MLKKSKEYDINKKIDKTVERIKMKNIKDYNLEELQEELVSMRRKEVSSRADF